MYIKNFDSEQIVPTVISISDKLATEAKIFAKKEHRSITGQIEHWAMIGKCAEENPELTYEFIKEILSGMADLKSFKGKVSLDIDLNSLRKR